ncbi:hypothetical protein L210DRAFT_3655116 [Boletus edulis BED1]|uniref:Uncharacterized protein n=1 Tax=Boletus edulis BED1 TaxID=1328754 RepID=A0AAD4G629_BOLED|nr:hypothetical protein L210DRAFT_3655116 [Boletus edulis BED1]
MTPMPGHATQHGPLKVGAGGPTGDYLRNTSKTSVSRWVNPPSPKPDKAAAAQRVQQASIPLQDNPFHNPFSRVRSTSKSAADPNEHFPRVRRRRPLDNPYARIMSNSGYWRYRDNPNVRQTMIQAKAANGSSRNTDSGAQKRQKLHADIISSTITSNGAPESPILYVPAARSSLSASKPNIQPIRILISDLRNPVPNEAEIIDSDVGDSSDEFSVSRAAGSSSPDPLSLLPRTAEVAPKILLDLCKSREDDVSEFTLPEALGRLSNTKKSQEVPRHIVRQHSKSARLSARANILSSGVLNAAREKERVQTLPLSAWSLGYHVFEHSESAPVNLSYEFDLQRISVTWGRSPPETIEFRLDRDIVNDLDKPLKENIMVQFSTTSGTTWKEAERKYKGFKGGGDRCRALLTLLFSTESDRNFCSLEYQRFIMGIKKAFRYTDVETVTSV